MKVRRKPVVVDAVIYNGKLPTDPEFAHLRTWLTLRGLFVYRRIGDSIQCPLGHWIIRDTDGSFDVVDPETMQKFYEPLYGEDEL